LKGRRRVMEAVKEVREEEEREGREEGEVRKNRASLKRR